MKEYNIKELTSSNIAVNCKTKKQAKNFLKYLHSQGYTWVDGSKPLDHLFYFDMYLAETCFELPFDKCIMYSPTLYYKGDGYKIIPLKDIKIKKEKKR